MSDTFDTKMEASVAEIGAHDSTLKTLKTSLDGWINEADRIRKSALNAWMGQAADAFDTRARSIDEACRATAGKLSQYQGAVSTLYYALTPVKSDLAGILSEAQAAGLTVVGTVVRAPKAPTFMQAPGSPPVTAENNPVQADYERKVGVWNGLVPRWEEARSKEAQAHNAFQRTCAGISAPEGWSAVAKAFGISSEGKDIFFLGAEAATSGSDATGAAMVVKFGRFAYRDKGKYAKLPASMRDRIKAYGDDSFWQNRPKATPGGRSALRTGKGLLKWAGRLGGVMTAVSAAVDAWDAGSQQWERDSYDPTLSTSEKVVRSLVVGTSAAAAPTVGALAGAAGGAAGGAAIGTLICPGPGTVIGGVIGGILGGLVGGAAGNATRDAYQTPVEGWVDKFIRW